MLPDYLAYKRIVSAAIGKAATIGGPITGKIRSVIIHEGQGFETVLAIGSRSRTEMTRTKAGVEITVEEMRSGDLQVILQKLSELRDQIGSEQDRQLLETVGASADSVGNVVSAGGTPLGPDHILAALAKVELQFNEDGTWNPQTFIIHPRMTEQLAQAIRRLNEEPALRERLDNILERGKRAWSDRESNRKLVD